MVGEELSLHPQRERFPDARPSMHRSGGTERVRTTSGSSVLSGPERSETAAPMMSSEALKRPAPSPIVGGSNHPLDRSSRIIDSSGSVDSRRNAYSRSGLLDSGRVGRPPRRRGGKPRSRCDLWLSLAVAQLVGVGSLASSSSSASLHYSSPPRLSAEASALALGSLSFAVSFAVGAGHSHRLFRKYLTTPLSDRGNHFNRSFLTRIRGAVTLEEVAALLVLILTSAASGMVLYPDSGGGRLAVVEGEVRNANLFYSAWADLYGAAHLCATVMVCSAIPGREGRSVAAWFVVAFSSVCASFATFVVHSGPSCQGYVLAESADCQVSLIAGVLEAFGAVFSLLWGACLLRSAGTNGGWSGPRTQWTSLLAASALLALYSAAVGLASSAPGPGTGTGSPFIASWTTWVLGLLQWKRCVESHLSPPTEPAVSKLKSLERSVRSGGDADTVSDTDSEAENYAAASVEAGGGGDSNSDEDSFFGDGSRSTVSHGTMMHCLESLSRNSGHEEYNDGDVDSDDVDSIDQAEYRPIDPSQEEYGGGEGAGHRNEAYRCGPSVDLSGYYSTPGAVDIRAESQGGVSTLEGDAPGAPWRRTPAGGRWMIPNSERPRAPRGSMPPSTSGRRDVPRRPLYREPVAHTSEAAFLSGRNGGSGLSSPNSEDVQEWDFAGTAAPRSPIIQELLVYDDGELHRVPSQFTNSGSQIDREWDFADLQQGPTSAATPTGAYARRASRDSLMSNLPPLEEASRETSPSSGKFTISTKTTGLVLGMDRRRSKGHTSGSDSSRKLASGAGSASKSIGSRSHSREVKGKAMTPLPPPARPPPPPPPKPGHLSPLAVAIGVQGEKKPSEGSSTNPTAKTVGPVRDFDPAVSKILRSLGGVASSASPGAKLAPSKRLRNKREVASDKRRTDTVDSDSVSLSSSDFDIIVPDGYDSVLTDLTQEGFETAAAFADYAPRRWSPPRLPQTPPRALPMRLPMHKDSSTLSGLSAQSPGRQGGREMPMSVEAFLADAVARACLSGSRDELDEAPPTADEESSRDRSQEC